jgi:hypothetical protein
METKRKPTITSANKLYKEAALRKGWHVYHNGTRIGYNSLFRMSYIVANHSSEGYRLVGIQGNILSFEV